MTVAFVAASVLYAIVVYRRVLYSDFAVVGVVIGFETVVEVVVDVVDTVDVGSAAAVVVPNSVGAAAAAAAVVVSLSIVGAAAAAAVAVVVVVVLILYNLRDTRFNNSS